MLENICKKGGLKMILTKEYLEKVNVCKDAIDFFQRNFPDGLDLDKFEILGDFNNYISWLRNSLSIRYEYDSRDNMIKQIDPRENVWQWEYDSRGNKIKQINPNGCVYQWKYDSRDNMVKQINPNGCVYQWKYIFKDEILVEIRENDKKICWLNKRR